MAIFHPAKVSIFMPQTPEHATLDAMIKEAYEARSTELMWWTFSPAAASANQDSIDAMFGETTSQSQAMYSERPYRVYANNQVNPIIMEVTRLGGQTVKDIDLFCGIAAMSEYLEGADPRPGDVFRLTRLGRDPKVDREYDYYVVSHVWPVDEYNSRFTSWQIAAEQTNMSDLPDSVTKWEGGE